MDNQPNNYDLVVGFLQVFDLLLNLSQSSNDDILKELQRQNSQYLDTIIKQNETLALQNARILEELEKIKDCQLG